MTQSRYAPAILAIARVPMNGALFPLEEMRPRDWIGKPVTFNHPTAYGQFRAAEPKDAIGEILDAWVDGDRLKGTIRVDVSRTPRHVLDMIDRGDPVDVSTGYTTREECPPHGGYCIHRDIKPDHLAIVPLGACSWADGCGIRSNLKVNTVTKTRFQSSKHRYSGKRPQLSDRELLDEFKRNHCMCGCDAPVANSSDCEAFVAMSQHVEGNELSRMIANSRADNEHRQQRALEYCRRNPIRRAPQPAVVTNAADREAIEAMSQNVGVVAFIQGRK